MGISTSMNAGVSGLNANGNKLSTIADNIANSETYGYKRSDMDFSSMTVSAGGSSGVVGGGRAALAGGVSTNAIWNIAAKGALEGTSNSTDIAVSGRGMLPVTSLASYQANADDLDLMLTTTGSFHTDKDGYLTTSSGIVLLGWPADTEGNILPAARDTTASLEPVKINLSSVSAVPTENINMYANLPATDTGPDGTGTARMMTLEYFDSLGSAQNLTVSYTPTVADPQSNEWTMEIVDEKSGNSVGTYTITFSDATATAGQVASVVQVDGGAGAYTTSYDTSTGQLTMELNGQTIMVAIGSDSGGPQYLSQLSSSFSSKGVTHDGSPAGTYQGVTIDENGFIKASYSSGFSKVLYQVPLADVANLDGLSVLDNQCFAVSAASGSLYLWEPGDGPTGTVEGFALELSTTDIATELTDMIRTQRAYSSNAKIIQTVDEMLQETTNLKR
ncbi:flagellar hook-basal body complex protein [Rhodobacteraceae bacterium DSL-40]|uniref:flagellar hook protein FlgE n=1 Tax=Amaricoccus sp. B4 TaxID=3368557 RepID=UPI000DAD45C5